MARAGGGTGGPGVVLVLSILNPGIIDMTNSQKLLLEQSKKRERINEILAKDAANCTDEERAELGTLTGPNAGNRSRVSGRRGG